VAKPDQVRRALLDASCLIGSIAGDPAFAALRSLLRAVDEDRVTLLESPRTELVDVTVVVARRAAELRVEHGLKTWDAIHLATGIVSSVDVVFVRDVEEPQTHGRRRAVRRARRPGDRATGALPGLQRGLHRLVFNEGYTGDVDLAAEAIRLTGELASMTDDEETAGLLALILLHHGRRPARTRRDGSPVPLAGRTASRWNTSLIAEGVAVLQTALGRDAR